MWVFTKDYISGESGTNVGIASRDYKPGAFGHLINVTFRLLDDDGEVYYEGLMSLKRFSGDEFDVFEPLDWAAANDGCTEMQVFNKKTKEWETV